METYESLIATIFGSNAQAICFWKARVALYATLKALGIGPKDEVILPGYTCVVVANAVRFTGAIPVYADIAAGNYNIEPSSVEANISPRTRALIVQHTYGISADLDRLIAIADKYKLDVIEDCAHVLVGSSYHGRLLGSFGKAAFFSSQWSKAYTTGLGGFVVTRDPGLGEKLKHIHCGFRDPPVRRQLQLRFQYWLHRHLFKPSLYWFSRNSLNTLTQFGLFLGSSNSTELVGKEPTDNRWRMADFQRRLGRLQLESLRANACHRQQLARYYESALREQGWLLNQQFNFKDLTLVRFPLQVANKSQFLDYAQRAHVEIGSWFETPLHPILLNEHQSMGYRLNCCPVAESTAKRVINLPLHSRITWSDAEKVVRLVLNRADPIDMRLPVSGTTDYPDKPLRELLAH